MPRIVFKGVAALTYPGESEFTGEGFVSQRDDGRLHASITINGLDRNTILGLSNLNPESFRLICPDGRVGRSTTWMTTNTTSPLMQDTPQVLIEGLLMNFKMVWPHVPSEDTWSRYRFFLTNLEFLGTEGVVRKYRNRRTGTLSQMTLRLSPNTMTLRWMPNYDHLIKELRASRGVTATAHLNLNPTSPTPRESILEQAEEVCTLLSLGTGNQVTWIEIREYASNGKLISTTYRNSVTRRFGRMPLISTNAGSDLRRLVEDGISNLRRWESDLGAPTDRHPLRNAIRLALDARTEGTYIQSRTLAALIVIEMLATKLALKRNTEFLLKKSRFAKIRRQIRQRLSEVLKSAGVDDDVSGQMKSKLTELNRPEFKKKIENLLLEAGLPLGENTLDLFLKIRNSMVHTGDYLPDRGIPNHEQHYAVLEFVDRVFLGLLDYKGKYISFANGWESAELNPSAGT